MRVMQRTTRSRSRQNILILALAATACSDSAPPNGATSEFPRPDVTMTQGTFSWTSQTEVRLVVGNPFQATVYYSACPAFWLERWDNGWKSIPYPFGIPTGASACQPRELEAHGTVEHILPLNNTVFPVAGWYRVLFNLYKDSAGQTAWSEYSRSSQVFYVGP